MNYNFYIYKQQTQYQPMTKDPSNTGMAAAITGATAAAGDKIVVVVSRFGAETTAHETHQQHEAPCRSQSLSPAQVMLHEYCCY